MGSFCQLLAGQVECLLPSGFGDHQGAGGDPAGPGQGRQRLWDKVSAIGRVEKHQAARHARLRPKGVAGDQFPGSNRNKNGIGGSAVFANIGGDIGTSTAWRVGASYLTAAPNGRSYPDVDALGGATTNTFTGNARLAGLNGVVKWSPNGNSSYYNFKLQGEYFRLRQNGSLVYSDAAGSNVFGQVAGSLDASQSGWYTQAVWQFHPQWRVGYRYDRLNYSTLNNGIVTNGLGPAAADFPVLANHSPTRNTLMLDWSPTEFSRIRLQYATDKSRLGLTDNQLFVQYIYSMGAHGAHKF